jgi:Protein of unknown function (DUF3891)
VILTRVDDGLLVVRQTDHADQTGLIAHAWGNELVAPIDHHHDSAGLAARHHDDGWALWERRPTIDPTTGQPYQFLALPPDEHLPLYRAGIARAAQHDPMAGILVSMHGAGLYNDRYGTFRLTEQHFTPHERALVDEFLADMQQLQDGLLALTGHRPLGHAAEEPEVMSLYLALQIWDRLSLQFAFRLAADGRIGPLPQIVGDRFPTNELRCRNDGSLALRIFPYPFADDHLSFPVEASVVADRAYRTPEDFLAEIAAATPTILECTVRADAD